MRTFIILVLVILLAIAGWWYWGSTHPDRVSVTVVYVSKGTVEETVANTRAGTVKACRRAKMSPSIGGQISELSFREGESVKQGDVLLKLWNKDLQADIVHSQSSVVTAADTAKAACLMADVATRSSRRSQSLYKAGTISREVYDQAKSNADALQAQCEAANSNMDAAMAAVTMAEARLQRTILTAPFDGVIANINGELNEYVTPSPPGIATPPVIDLIEPGCFYVSAPIDEVDAPKIQSGLKVRLTLDAWKERVFYGEVIRVGSYVIDLEKQARTVDVELKFTNQDDLQDLLVGYSADVDIVIETHEDVLNIPTGAMLDDRHVLFYDPASEKLEKRAIEKGLSNWNLIEITSGLVEGDAVVTSLGSEKVKAGVLVEISSTER